MTKGMIQFSSQMQEYNPDALCLQECGDAFENVVSKENTVRFTEESDYKYIALRGTNAIFSKIPILEM